MGKVDDAIASMVKNIENKTGKTVPTWIELARASGFGKHKEIYTWLKAKHGLGHAYANYIALQTLKAAHGSSSSDDVVAHLFEAAKAKLRPLYDSIIEIAKGFGSDVEIAPKKANVSLRRSKQFALLQPSTADRLDIGLILKGVKPSGRLESSGSFNAMFTHRVRVTRREDIDDELKRWLRQAYDAA